MKCLENIMLTITTKQRKYLRMKVPISMTVEKLEMVMYMHMIYTRT